MMPRRRDFLESTLERLAASMEQAARAEQTSSAPGLLQRLDPRAKLLGLLSLIIAASASHHLPVTAALLALALLLSLASGPRVLGQIARLWAGILLFTAAIVLPSLFLTPGPALLHLPWIGWAITAPGLHSALGLISRAETAATLAALLALTTPWARLLKALRALRVPPLVIVILSMTYRYIFLLLAIAHDFFEARRARRVGKLSGPQRRQMSVSSAAVLLSKSVQLSGEGFEAMQARGFRGEALTLDTFRMKPLDWTLLAAFLCLATIAFVLGTR